MQPIMILFIAQIIRNRDEQIIFSIWISPKNRYLFQFCNLQSELVPRVCFPPSSSTVHARHVSTRHWAEHRGFVGRERLGCGFRVIKCDKCCECAEIHRNSERGMLPQKILKLRIWKTCLFVYSPFKVLCLMELKCDSRQYTHTIHTAKERTQLYTIHFIIYSFRSRSHRHLASHRNNAIK